MSLDNTQKRSLKSKAHHLDPVVMIGSKGLTDAIFAETEAALLHHELIKIKIKADREERQHMAAQLCTRLGAELIQVLGQTCVIYRKNRQAKKS